MTTDTTIERNTNAVTDTSFEEEVLKSEQPVLVDFWAEWCGPCKAVEPLLEQIETEYAGRVKVRRLNVDENPSTTNQYRIRSIPSLILFKNGETKGNKVGVIPKRELRTFIDSHI